MRLKLVISLHCPFLSQLDVVERLVGAPQQVDETTEVRLVVRRDVDVILAELLRGARTEAEVDR